MKNTHIFFSILMAAVLCLAGTSWAGEASVFDDVQKIIIRAYTVATGTLPAGGTAYSAYLEVMDSDGVLVPAIQLVVTPLPAGDPLTAGAAGNYTVRENNLSSPDFSISFDNKDGITYLICTNGGVDFMKFQIRTSSPINAVCGSADRDAFYSAPTTNLCNVTNTPAVVTGAGPWSWTCTGINGGSNATCSAYKKVDGQCGSSNGGTFTSAPTTNLCNVTNTPAVVTGAGPWSWTCNGSNGGSSDSCSANIQTSSAADLTVSYFKATSAGSNGLAVPATVKVTNIGTGAAGPFKVKIYMSHGITPEGSQLLVNGTKTVSGLAAGATATLTFSDMTFSGLILHTYYHIIAVADADSQVGETNEDNNIKYRDFEVM